MNTFNYFELYVLYNREYQTFILMIFYYNTPFLDVIYYFLRTFTLFLTSFLLSPFHAGILTCGMQYISANSSQIY